MATRGTVSISLEGDLTLQARLRELTPRLEKSALRTALRESARPMLAAARRFAPVHKTNTFTETVWTGKRWGKRKFATGRIGGSLRKSLRIKAFKRSRKNRVGVSIGTSALASAYQGQQFYGAFQEFGWKVGTRNRGAAAAPDARRFIEGKKYIRKAFNLTKHGVRRQMRTQIMKAIDKVVARDLSRNTRKAKKAAAA